MPAIRSGGKSETAFRTISEVSSELDIPQHVLRFWESKFTQVKPLKRGGGRRYYRPEDVILLRRISEFLYTDGYTIKGVQRILREAKAVVKSKTEAKSGSQEVAAKAQTRPSGAPASTPARTEGGSAPTAREELVALRSELIELRDLLRSLKT